MSWARLQKAQDANPMVKDIFLEHLSIQKQWKTHSVWTALKNTRSKLQLHFLHVTAELTPDSLSSYPYTELILKECTNCFVWLWWRWLNFPIMQAIPETSKTMLTDEKQCSGNSLGGISKIFHSEGPGWDLKVMNKSLMLSLHRCCIVSRLTITPVCTDAARAIGFYVHLKKSASNCAQINGAWQLGSF